MAKIILEFDSYEDAEELKDALAGTKNAGKLEDIWMECFRPARKYGAYNSSKINEILEKIEKLQGSTEDDMGYIPNLGIDLIDLISEIYLEIRNED